MKAISSALLLAAFAASSVGHAAGWYAGQSGQYHLVPAPQDLQYLTLIGQPDPVCSGGTALFAVDEFGKVETTPFAVPSQTVFLLTDVAFEGVDGAHDPIHVGWTPWLQIVQNTPNSIPRASFLATKSLTADQTETFVGHGSLESGVAFPANSKLCASLQYHAPFGGVLALNTLEVHGKVVTNYRTNSSPYFSW